MMKIVYFMAVFPLFAAVSVGCGGSGESKIIAPSEVISPSEEASKTEEYAKEMSKMTN